VAWAATAPISPSSSKFWGCSSASKDGKKRSGREGGERERQVEREREREKQRGRQIQGEGQVEGRGESS